MGLIRPDKLEFDKLYWKTLKCSFKMQMPRLHPRFIDSESLRDSGIQSVSCCSGLRISDPGPV